MATRANSIPPVSALSDLAEVSCLIERWLKTERLASFAILVESAPGWAIVCEEHLDPSGAVVSDVYLLHRVGARVPPGPNVFHDADAVAREIERLRKVVA